VNGPLIGVMAVIVAAFVVAMIWEGIKEYRKMKAWEHDFQARLDAVRREHVAMRDQMYLDHFNRKMSDRLSKEEK